MSNLPVPESGPNPAAVPEYLQSAGVLGMEAAKASDLIFPRLNVMQANSPAVGEGKFNPGDIVRSDTQDIVCPQKGFVHVYPVIFKREWLHWAARDTKQGLLGRSSDENSEIAKKARTQLDWVRRTRKPINTNQQDSFNESHTWLVALDGTGELVVLTFARGSIMDSRQLISIVNSKNANRPADKKLPLFAFRFRITPFYRKKPRGSWWIPEPKHDGWAPQEVFEQLKQVYEGLNGKNFGASDYDQSEGTQGESAAPDNPEY